ncbi:MAG: DUF1302 family protein [Candidatus Binataceae bacterium]
MTFRGKSLRGLIVALTAVVLGSGAWSSAARADDFFTNLKNNFQLNGYVEAQQIWRNENFVKGYHVASLRNRIDVQPSGQFIKDINFGPIHNLSIEYFMEVRPGYEGAYSIINDRFGDRPTGFSGTGSSPFQRPIVGGAGVALLKAFGYKVKQFRGYGARSFAFPDPVAPNEHFIIPCQGCVNTNVSQNDLEFERDDSNRDYYPIREAYLDFNWDMLGQNLIRLGKQQTVWGKADFFRLQDIVNPVDFSQHFFIEPFEDTRIPQLTLWYQHRFGDVGSALQDLAGNVVWNFDQFNPVGLGQSGQPWAVEFGDAKRAFAFNNGLFTAGLCGGAPGCNGNNINFALDQEHTPQWRFRNDGIGTKWDWEIPQGVRFALTDYWGIRDIPGFVNTRLNTTSAFNPACPTFATITGGGKSFTPAGVPVTVLRPSQIHLAPGVRPDTYIDNCTFGGEIQIFYKKVNTLGLSADYFEPRTGLVFRVESSWTHNASLTDTNSLTLQSKDDILAYVFGMDLPHFIKFLNPDRTFFSSVQVFETYYPGAHSTDGGKRGIITGVNNFTLTAFTQTHYYRDQVIPLAFVAFGTEGTDATIGGDTEWLISNHWSARLGIDAFLGKQHQHDLSTFATFCKITPSCAGGQTFQPFSETAFGAGHEQAGGAERNVMDEFWTRVRYRF